MVFFNCNACGESLKKNQVEKHYMTKCRKCEVLSCVDCGKEFWGDAFKEHTKCISEEEKYSGKNFKPKANANKGERKQEQWTEQVQQAIEKAPANNPKLKGLLNQLMDYPNIPRKQAKFENFVKNSMRVREPYLISQAWDALSAGMPSQNQSQASADAGMKTQPEASTSTKTEEEPTNGDVDSITEEPKKLSKREKKEERRKQKNKPEKKDKGKENKDDEKSEKKKKRKHEEMEETGEGTSDEPVDEAPRKSKKSKKHKEEIQEEMAEVVHIKKKSKKDGGENSFEICKLNETIEADDEDSTSKKFKLDTVVLEILNKASDKEMTMKKLIKKVQGAFLASGGGGKGNSQEKMLSKLQKRLNKDPQYKVHKDRVKLITDGS